MLPNIWMKTGKKKNRYYPDIEKYFPIIIKMPSFIANCHVLQQTAIFINYRNKLLKRKVQ